MDTKAPWVEPDAQEMTELLLRVMDGVNAQAFRRYGNRVLTGPFTGMIIPERTPWADGNASTKLIGTYEHELHDVVETALWRRPEVVINVGCAEGYYAIGFARRGLEVQALDISEDSLRVLEEFGELNGVRDKITVYNGAHNPEELLFSEYDFTTRLYVIDCEGEELTLIDLDRCPSLLGADIIVECHDFLRPGVSSALADRLWKTHRVEIIRPRLPDLRLLEKLPTAINMLAVVEKRPMPCCWLACWANKRGAKAPNNPTGE